MYEYKHVRTLTPLLRDISDLHKINYIHTCGFYWNTVMEVMLLRNYVSTFQINRAHSLCTQEGLRLRKQFGRTCRNRSSSLDFLSPFYSRFHLLYVFVLPYSLMFPWFSERFGLSEEKILEIRRFCIFNGLTIHNRMRITTKQVSNSSIHSINPGC